MSRRSVTDAEIAEAARRAHVPERLLRAQIGAESSNNQGALSPKGAAGVEQLMPGTARYVSRKYGVDTNTAYGNLLGGAYYLREQYDAFKSWRLALAAYNAGPGAVETYHGVPPYRETQDYVSRILSGAGTDAGSSNGRIPGSDPGDVGSTPTPAAPDLHDVALQGLGDLAQGHYDPMKGLAAVRRATVASQGLSEAPGGIPAVGPSISLQGRATKRDRGAIALVQQYLGTPYHWGGSSPKTGFDCSGLLQYVWAQQGVQIPRVTYEQWKAGKAVARGALRPGDAVFFEPGPQGPGHVGMYIGGGKFIESPHTGANVRISRLAGRKDYMGARRFA